MRLVCPNCEAKYEVPEDAIPETGRDVQCANCGHAWYQMRSRPQSGVVAPAVSEPVAPEAALAKADPAPEVLTQGDAVEEMTADIEAADAMAASEATSVEPSIDAGTDADFAAASTAALEAAVEDAQPEIPASLAVGEEDIIVTAESLDQVSVDVVSSDDSAGSADSPDVSVEEPDVSGVDPAGIDAVETIENAVSEIPAAESDISQLPELDADIEPAEETEPQPESAPIAHSAAYAVDESVLAILREEAEREAQARRNEAKPLEMQPDLGVDAAFPAAKKAVEVVSFDGPDVDEPVAGEADPEARPSARRDLLPNVEEINSTLRPSDHPSEDTSDQEAAVSDVAARSSFRSGFLLVMTITILGAAIYISADSLKTLVPALAGPLDSFVGFVDGLRLQLDGLMQNATVAINGDGG